jgi:hypothetical protein
LTAEEVRLKWEELELAGNLGRVVSPPFPCFESPGGTPKKGNRLLPVALGFGGFRQRLLAADLHAVSERLPDFEDHEVDDLLVGPALFQLSSDLLEKLLVFHIFFMRR